MAYGRWCAVTCGPAVAAMAVTELPPVLTGELAAGLLAERIAQRPRTASLRLAAAIVAGMLLAAVAEALHAHAWRTRGLPMTVIPVGGSPGSC